MRRSAPRIVFSLSGLLLCAAARRRIPAVQEERFEANALTLSRLTLQEGSGAPVRYYLSRPAHKAPLVLFIQGSGCVPSFMNMGTPERKSTIPYWATLASQGRMR
jgi:hypothetical protein